MTYLIRRCVLQTTDYTGVLIYRNSKSVLILHYKMWSKTMGKLILWLTGAGRIISEDLISTVST